MAAESTAQVEERVLAFQKDCHAIAEEVGKMIVGHRDIIEGVITAMLAGGNVLLEGVPGLGKTMLVRTLSQTLGLDFSRIQFTPDLMPSDILGTTVLIESEDGQKHFRFERGPIFANVVLADEINRATPKTQSAMLEAMQERSVTIGKDTMQLENPFFVLATQNPLEMDGTYPLPEAQLDRFLFKLVVRFPDLQELHTIMDRTTQRDQPDVERVIGQERLVEMKLFARDVPVARHIQDYALRLLQATHPEHGDAPDITRRYVRYGSSPRGAQSILMAAKVRALFDGRFNVSSEDIRKSAVPALRHRIILNFEGEAEGVETDEILDEILDVTPENKKG
jgi:MoxR-like ATPase